MRRAIQPRAGVLLVSYARESKEVTQLGPRLTFKEAAIRVLEERGPMHYRDLAGTILDAGWVQTDAVNPSNSLNAMIAVDIRRNGLRSPFIRLSGGIVGLRTRDAAPKSQEQHRDVEVEVEVDAEIDSEADEVELRVRTPLYPLHREVRALLKIWPGVPRRHVTGLRATIGSLRGTPQKNVDWTDPDRWIPERLTGDDRELASLIWERSKRTVNPRHTYGHWLLAQRYRLIEEGDDGRLRLTDAGRSFLDQPDGDVEAAIDEAEGLIKLLSIVADNGPARPGELLEDWSAYLKRRSRFQSETTFKDTLHRRLRALLDRGLLERKSALYSATDRGLAYLARVGDEDSVEGDAHHEIQTLVRNQAIAVRSSLRELLLELDPFAFEHLVKRLLEELGYRDVEVTSRSGDGGVDVIGEIELGITSVREVVQAKRHRRAVQRKDLDALRGSLYRFNAVRGTIVTTARFAKGAEEAAFANGAAPITLIDGEKLIDLLIEHGIGVKKRQVDLLELDPTSFADLGEPD